MKRIRSTIVMVAVAAIIVPVTLAGDADDSAGFFVAPLAALEPVKADFDHDAAGRAVQRCNAQIKQAQERYMASVQRAKLQLAGRMEPLATLLSRRGEPEQAIMAKDLAESLKRDARALDTDKIESKRNAARRVEHLRNVLKGTTWSRKNGKQTVTLHADGTTSINWGPITGSWHVTDEGVLVTEAIGYSGNDAKYRVTDAKLLSAENRSGRQEGDVIWRLRR
jgi:hypothetical protein